MPTSLKHTDPTYLRTIHDGLLSGSVHKDNASALPQGLVGMYEEALPPAVNVNERKKFLEFFAVWALLKKEVSAGFVVPLLEGWAEAEVVEYIAQYSKWFNSPVSGKFVLYHERLRVYLLQKIGNKASRALNLQLITLIEKSLHEKTVGELEVYGLEFIIEHLVVESMLTGDGQRLLQWAYSPIHWERQLKISKEYTWTKKDLKSVMTWASKYSVAEVIECGLQMVDLQYQQKNSAPEIIAMVVEGDIESALKRIENFGGTDEEGVKRRFTLYMLCLMELTLLESKTKPFRKTAIEKLLNHLDEQIPPDTSIINWNDFFPSYLMFLMASEWAELGLDYLIIYKRTYNWEKDWIPERSPYTPTQFEVLLACARGISEERGSSTELKHISTELAKQCRADEALPCARGISDVSEKSSALAAISTKLGIQGKIDEAASAMQEALTCARGISSDYGKISALKDIYTELAEQGKVDEAASAMQEALTCARGISDDYWKSRSLKDISTELAKQGRVDETLTCARGISDESDKSSALADISTELGMQGKIDEAASAMQEALTCARGISDDYWKSRALRAISSELATQGKVDEAASAMQEALTCARGISEESVKSLALAVISSELANQGKVDEAASAIREALTCARGISSHSKKSHSLKAISSELAKQGKVDEALTCTRGISNGYIKNSTLKDISSELAKQGKVNEAASAMQEALICARGISDESDKSLALKAISSELAIQGKVDQALTCARGVSHDYWKSEALQTIATELGIQGKVDEAASAMQEALTCVRGISDDYWKSSSLKDIPTELAKQGRLEEALAYARGISDESDKSSALAAISTELGIQGKIDETASAMQEALTCASGISSDYGKSCALKDISTEMAKQGNWELAETTGMEISQLSERHNCWKAIAGYSCKEFGWQKALHQVNELQSDEARLFYLKGWAEAVNEYDADAMCVQEALNQMAHDSESIETLLQKYALHEVFFGNAGPDKINQLNRTLNIQWAIDIKDSFSAN